MAVAPGFGGQRRPCSDLHASSNVRYSLMAGPGARHWRPGRVQMSRCGLLFAACRDAVGWAVFARCCGLACCCLGLVGWAGWPPNTTTTTIHPSIHHHHLHPTPGLAR